MRTAWQNVSTLLLLSVSLSILTLNTAHLNAAEFTILDASNNTVSDAVIEVTSATTHSTSTAMQNAPSAEMGQKDKQFSPRMIAVRQGTTVSLPNYDDIKHHIFSFSPANTFEKSLPKGSQDATLSFNSAGIVELGCNVHDWMMGYVYVAASPLFAISGESGQVTISNTPKGQLHVKVWHELLGNDDSSIYTTRINPDSNGKYIINLPVDIAEQDAFDIDELGDY